MTLLIITSLIVAAAALYLWLSKSQTSQQPLRSEYSSLLQAHIKYFRKLNSEQKQLFVERVHAFLQQVHIEGVGTEVTLTDKILVAASAIIPIFGFGDWRYPNITNVIIYPDTFNEEFQFEGSGRATMGMVGTGYMNGQMILSKSALHAGFAHQDSTSNTPIHEFVHLLDKTDGATDGIPEQLMEERSLEPWLKLMHGEIERINNGQSDINPYATTGDAEFFAVVSEYFFQQPHLMATNHPEIYKMLSGFYRQDWVTGTAGG